MTEATLWDEIDGATELGKAVADDLRALVTAYEAGRDRSKQTVMGPSGVGTACVRCMARAALGCPVRPEFDDPWCRIIGTAVHTWLDEAAVAACVRENRARWLAELRVHPDDDLLPKGGRCDLVDTDRFMVIDHKVVGVAPLRKYRMNGPGPQYRAQGHLYGLGWANAGNRVDHVAVAFWPRGGRLSELYVWTEPYDEQIARAALERWRTIRDQALAIGPVILPLLPADPDCWDCEGRDDL